MGIAVIILVAVLVVVCMIAAAAIYTMYVWLKRERTRFDRLAEGTFDYRMEWNEDLSRVHFSANLLTLLADCGIKADKDYIISVFSGPDVIVDGVSMSVNALKEDGVISTYTDSDGREGIIRWKSVSVTQKDRQMIYSMGTDMSHEAPGSRDELIKEFDYMKTAVSNAEAGAFSLITEGEQTVIKTTPDICSLLGFNNTDIISLERFYMLVKKEELLGVQRSFNRFLSGVSDTLYTECFVKTAIGAYHCFTIECRFNKDATDYRQLRTGMLFDTTSNRIHREAINNDSRHDALTGLYSRKGFMQQGDEFLEKCRKDGSGAAIICIQIPRLRKISTLFGIEVADTLTKLYAETMLRLTDERAVIGKMSLEDYAMLIGLTDKKEIEKLLKSITIVVENFCNNETLPSVLKEQIGIDAGVCFFDNEDDVATLYNKASVTLFSGTAEPGEVCRYFNAEVEKKVSGRDIVEHEIGEALRQGELELYYQPKVNIRTGEMIGAEALMRWNHKTQGIIMPGEFIHVAEEMGIITKIDEWGMLQACIQNRMWKDKGYPDIKISVNMSQAQLYQTDVVESVKSALEESGISAESLEVELTETMAMIDIERTVKILNDLKKLGVSISMDDFGTGYSSLSSLKILPIDILKIDRSLVYDIETNDTARCITKAIVEMGKALKLTVLAEGVETESQRAILEELGCDIAQGFLYSRPQPAAIIEREFLIPAAEKKNQAEKEQK